VTQVENHKKGHFHAFVYVTGWIWKRCLPENVKKKYNCQSEQLRGKTARVRPIDKNVQSDFC
jgi:hypothetical protein